MSQDRPTRARYFTPAEANRLLPRLIEKVATAAGLVQAFEEAVGQLEGDSRLDPDARQAIARHANELRSEARVVIDEISDLGVEVKDLRPALLDFPALRHGQEVFLCWREGERQIAWWHPMPTGFAGRQPLDDDEPGIWEWCN